MNKDEQLAHFDEEVAQARKMIAEGQYRLVEIGIEFPDVGRDPMYVNPLRLLREGPTYRLDRAILSIRLDRTVEVE